MKKIAKIVLIITTIVTCVMAYNRVSSSQQANNQQILEYRICGTTDSAHVILHAGCVGETDGSTAFKECKE